MKSFDKWPGLKLWLPTALVVSSVYWLVGRDRYEGLRGLIAVPFIFIHGIGDGHPSTEMKLFGGFLTVLSAVFVLFVIWLTVTLFTRLIKDKARSVGFKFVFIIGMLIIFSGIIFKGWTSNAESRVHNAIYIGDIAAYENALKWRKAGNIDDDLWCAARDGQLQMVQYLISKGANPNAKLGGNGDSVLAGANPNVMNRPDGNKPVTEYLKSHGATNEVSR